MLWTGSPAGKPESRLPVRVARSWTISARRTVCLHLCWAGPSACVLLISPRRPSALVKRCCCPGCRANVGFSLIADEGCRRFASLGSAHVLAVVTGRLSQDGGNHASPLSITGRLLTFRWIIPRDDYHLVAPLNSLGVSLTCVDPHFYRPHWPVEISVPVSIAPTCWTACLLVLDPRGNGPPRLAWSVAGSTRPISRNRPDSSSGQSDRHRFQSRSNEQPHGRCRS